MLWVSVELKGEISLHLSSIDTFHQSDPAYALEARHRQGLLL